MVERVVRNQKAASSRLVISAVLEVCGAQCCSGVLGLNDTVPLVDWISDTRSQGYTGLQSLVKCLDHR